MKHELSSFAIAGLRREGFIGPGTTLRVIGDDLQWVCQVEMVSHVDQVNIEIGIAFQTSPLMNRPDCRVLWSLPDFVGVESDDVARALLPVADCALEKRQLIVGDALGVMASFIRSHPSTSSIRGAYGRGELANAFVFADARELLGTIPGDLSRPSVVAELIQLGPMPTDDEAEAQPFRAARWEQLLGQVSAEGIVSDAQASSLVPLFPGDDSDSFGVAWTLVHVVESAPSWPIEDALESAPGPWADVLRRRARP